MNTKASNRDGLPESFLAQFGEHVIGFLSGFDRLRFRATLRPLFQPGGLDLPPLGIDRRGTGQILPLHVFGHATPDRAGARPCRVQRRVARCGMGLPAHASHPLSRLFACFAGPIP
jgi:hypothetical protein